MSHNLSRAERSDSAHYKKTSRSGSSNQQRSFSGVVSSKGGGGAALSFSNSSNRSVPKHNYNASEGQSMGRKPTPNADSNVPSLVHAAQNGAHQGQSFRRSSVAPETSSNFNSRLNDAPTHNPIPAISRTPSSNASPETSQSIISAASSESTPPTTPAKSSSNTSSSFPLQFGSISPGFMNGMQIPARTSSAPPNLDEQKKDQTHRNSSIALPSLPIPSIPKHNLPKKDTGFPSQATAGEAQSGPESRKEPQVSAASSTTQTQKPAILPVPGLRMQGKFHQQHVSAQFGGPKPQIQSQPMPGTSLTMPMQIPISIPFPMGNPQVQHPMFVPGLQPQHMQSQVITHPGQTLNFPQQMGPQIPHHLGNVGMNMVPQFSPQQGGKYSSSRKTVKITHPDTHEELRLDDSPGPRPHSMAPTQSQAIPSFAPNCTMNFFPNSYNAAPLYFPAVGSVPSTQVTPTSQPQRFYNQVAVKPAAGGPGSHGEKERLPSTSAPLIVKVESMKPSLVNIEKSAHSVNETEVSSSLPQEMPDLGTSVLSSTPPCSVNMEVDVVNISTSATADSNISSSVPSISSNDSQGVLIPDSNEGKNADKQDLQDQIGQHTTSSSRFPSRPLESKTVESNESLSETISIPEVVEGPSSTSVTPSPEVSNILEDSVSPGTIINMRGVLINYDTALSKKGGETIVSERLKHDQIREDTSLNPLTLESSDHACKTQKGSNNVVLDTSVIFSEQSHANHSEDPRNIETCTSVTSLSTSNGEPSMSDMPLTTLQTKSIQESMALDPSVLDPEPVPDLVSSPKDVMKHGNEYSDYKHCASDTSSSSSVVSDKGLSDSNLGKFVVPRGKKKKKDLYRKAEAIGTSSDIYVAYKGPEEKKDATYPIEGTEINSNSGIGQPTDESLEIASVSEKLAQCKVEPDDWEDAVEMSTPQIETSKCENRVSDGDVGRKHSYTRDFLLKFCDYAVLPFNFDLTADIAGALMERDQFSHEPYSSPGRNADRPTGRSDRRGSAFGDEEKWNKFPGPIVAGRGDMRPDVGYVGNTPGIRINQTGNYGVLRNPRAPISFQYVGGILSGPMQPIGPQGSLKRNNSDAEKWLRGTGFQKGLMPSTPTPLQVMHKTENKYEVGKVTDEEEAKQRQLKAILNKLTPQNFQKLFEQVKQVNIDNVVTLSGVIAQIFDKALMEPTFCEMYANFCFHLAADLPDLSVDGKTVTFKRLLLDKCQEEFEREEMEENEANKVEEEGEYKHTAEEREEKRLQARRRMLGNIRLIGELFKKRMLTERIMHDCINKLLGQNQTPDEENIEAFCKLMSTIGEMIDHVKAKEFMDAYFHTMSELSNDLKLSSRVRFMLKDVIDLRMNSWQQRRKVEGPKLIEEVHRDAAQERQAQASRLGRAASFGGPVRRAAPVDYSPRAPNTLLSPSSQMGGYRAAPPQARGHGSQDVRTEERHSLENRAIPVPLPQRPLGDEPITLGPQGGLARGMAFRGQLSAPNSLAEQSSGYGRRAGPGLNGSNSTSYRSARGQRNDALPRYSVDRTGAPPSYDRSYLQERNVTDLNRDAKQSNYGNDSSLPASPHDHGGQPLSLQDVSSEMVWPAQLEEKSMATIKEYYSARDESEVTLCIKDLNTPSYYPSMISLWVTDSFERKGFERDLLTKLLINLTQPSDGLIKENQLTKGFEFVLTALEETVNDAPRAAEYLGQIFAQLILEKVVELSEIGRLIYTSGEEPGHLVKIGLASDVLGSTLDTIKSEKGDFVLNEMCSSSNLQLESFMPKKCGEYR